MTSNRIRILALSLASVLLSPLAGRAAEPLHVYGPGGPAQAMVEAAKVFQAKTGTVVEITAGPSAKWVDKAKTNADLVYGGSEVMMSALSTEIPDIDPNSITPLYLRGAAILVRKGNPAGFQGVADLLKSGHRILVVDGAGQQGLWEDVAGRLGDVASVRALRANIAVFAKNSGDAKKVWQSDPTIDAWLIWTIWQTANPNLADQVAVESERDFSRHGRCHDQTRRDAFRNGSLCRLPALWQGGSIFKKFGWIAP